MLEFVEPKLFLRYLSDSLAFITVITGSMSASFSAQGSHLWIFDFQLLRFLVSKYCFLELFEFDLSVTKSPEIFARFTIAA